MAKELRAVMVMDKEAKAAKDKELTRPKNLFLKFFSSFLDSAHICVTKTGLLDLKNHACKQKPDYERIAHAA